MSKLFIGTSGFNYLHWENGIFYPKDLSKKKQLEYFAQHFKSVELNNTFYRLPSPKTFLNWQRKTPPDFLFAIKVSRFITHVKKLNQCQKIWKTFLERSLILEEKLGPFLFQLPPNWKINISRFKDFIKIIEENDFNLKFVFEFRNSSWFSPDTFQFFKNYNNISLCSADSPFWPKTSITGERFIYIRMHGRKILYSSNYSKKELKKLAFQIKKYLKKGLDVYCYFNNDARGFAVKNVKQLLEMI